MTSFAQNKLSIGDKAPDFSGLDQDGKQIALSRGSQTDDVILLRDGE